MKTGFPRDIWAIWLIWTSFKILDVHRESCLELCMTDCQYCRIINNSAPRQRHDLLCPCLVTFNSWSRPAFSVVLETGRGTLTVETGTTEQMPKDLIASLRRANGNEVRQILNNSRRIIMGHEATNTRPYMVYLKVPARQNSQYKRWLCGGVIVHPEYILTSAACIEDVHHFYVVSGTFTFSYADDKYSNPCIKNGAKKAVWKCIPRNYVFDGHENDNLRWMNNDIAVVRLEDEINFYRRVRGCEFIPKPVCYNNQSSTLENPGTYGSIAGWGSHQSYASWVNTRRGEDEQTSVLLSAPVTIMDKETCKHRWGRRYEHIIENYMICTSDLTSELSEICMEKYVDCQDILVDSSEEDAGGRRMYNPQHAVVHSAYHNYTRRSGRKAHGGVMDGGFCENDHGGPLIYGTGVNSVVIGIISACLVKEHTNDCYGPFLYTSVYKNHNFINCAINKDIGTDCSKIFRAGEEPKEIHMSWVNHPDGPAKNEIAAGVAAAVPVPADPETSNTAAVPVPPASPDYVAAPVPPAAPEVPDYVQVPVPLAAPEHLIAPGALAVPEAPEALAVPGAPEALAAHDALAALAAPEAPAAPESFEAPDYAANPVPVAAPDGLEIPMRKKFERVKLKQTAERKNSESTINKLVNKTTDISSNYTHS